MLALSCSNLSCLIDRTEYQSMVVKSRFMVQYLTLLKKVRLATDTPIHTKKGDKVPEANFCYIGESINVYTQRIKSALKLQKNHEKRVQLNSITYIGI